MKILIVDDQKENRYLLETLLKGSGHQVVSVVNGAEALEKLRDSHFHIIISDILMPVMDGFQLCHAVKKDKILKKIPFAFYTATYMEKEDEELAVKLGADKFIRKPVEPKEFVEIIEHLIQDTEKGEIKAAGEVMENEKEVSKLYNERLIHKLEEKMLILEKEISERKRVEEELKEYREHLEELVEKRTGELNRANEQLEKEIRQRKQAEQALEKNRYELEIGVEERTRDLTEANRQLQQEKEKAQQYLDIAGVMIVVINADQTVALINKRGCEVLGYEYEEIVGKNWFDHFLPENLRSEVKVVFEKLMAGELEPVENYENPVLTKNGEVRQIAWHNAVIRDEKGKILKTLSSGEDITESKQSQEMMIQTEKMMSIGGLAAGMAHEINNPLAGILQSIQVILGRIAPDSSANQKAAEACGTTIEALRAYVEQRKIVAFLEAAKKAGERAAVIVENMLSFSRKSEAAFEPNDIAKLLDKTIALAENEYDLRKKFDFRQIKIVREYTPGLPEVPCEATKIQQVVLNLLKNAAQAMHNPEAERKEPCITLRTGKEDDMVRIEVEDNGPGMPDEVRRRIFEPFYTTKGVGIGTGLGLSVSYFIITKNHGGRMEVQSTPGRGTTFIIRLPLVERGK